VKTSLKITGLIILISILAGCKTHININDYIDKNVAVKLKVSKKDNSTGLTSFKNFDIPVNSDKYKELIEWGNKNTAGWQSTLASFIADIYVGQGDFRMLYNSGSKGVVVGFKDKEGRAKQYSKTIMQGELDFLFK